MVKLNSDISGRDIKQIIKLAGLRAANSEQPVDLDALQFARQFIPNRATAGQPGAIDRAWPRYGAGVTSRYVYRAAMGTNVSCHSVASR